LLAAQRWESAQIEPGTPSHAKALLTILIATGEKAIEAFHASANSVDSDFLVELERIIERSRKELSSLTEGSSG
jgi:hypothetical protein